MNDVITPVRPRGGRRLVTAGVVVAVLALVVVVTSGAVVVTSVGGPLSETLTSPSRPTPVDENLSLKAGRYTVFELVGGRSSHGPVTTTRTGAPTVGPGAVAVTGPDGVTITASGDASGSESMTRGQDVYVGVARFAVAHPGEYHVRIDGAAGRRVVIAPSFGSGFGAVLNWVLAGVAGFAALVAGVVLTIVGAVRGRRPAGRATQGTRPAGPYSGRPVTGTGAPVPYAGPPEGWYPAPDVPGRERYWDGRAWTGHLRSPGR